MHLIADRVQHKSGGNNFNDGDDVEIEGIVTRFVSATDFDVNNIPVTTTSATVYEHGTSADIALNSHLEVEGEFNASGILVADEVEFEGEGILRVTGLVEDVQGDLVTVMGVTVTTTSETEVEDDSVVDDRTFSISALRVGDFVEIRGFGDASSITASRLERDDDDGDRSVRGFVTAVNNPEFTILGLTVATDSNTEFEHGLITATEFFDNAMGQLVDADGRFLNGVLQADDVEFEGP